VRQVVNNKNCTEMYGQQNIKIYQYILLQYKILTHVDEYRRLLSVRSCRLLKCVGLWQAEYGLSILLWNVDKYLPFDNV
jgi:hypothetical protein